MPERRFHAAQAWVDGRWARDVLLVAGADGAWAEVRSGCADAARAGAQVLPGPVLPGLVNGHSHAFQRAMAGLAERGSDASRDDFWSWRERMYALAARITPPQLEEIAAFVYAELVQAGTTQVCEFHYLHRDKGGRPYAAPLELALALVRAARRAGIGLTLLPTLYMRGGFAAADLRQEQRRFASTPDEVLRTAQALRQQGGPLLTAGVALHSLRAVEEGALRELAAASRAPGWPVHIHVAEQQQEVDECLVRHGQRPLEWLLQQAQPDARWNLVHATHADAAELAGVHAAGAAIVLCPSTEANLGDGLFDLPAWLGLGGAFSIGSDSHVTRSWCEELRLLEYGQRLLRRRRNVAGEAAPQRGTAAVLFEGVLQGGSAASGLRCGGLRVGERADFQVLDPLAPALLGVPEEQVLDACVFSAPQARPLRVVVAGQDVPESAQPDRFRSAMQALWGA